MSEITCIMCIIFVDFHLSLAFWDYFLWLLKTSLRKLRTKPRSRKSQMKSLCWGGLFLKYFPKSMLDPWTWLRIMNKESCKSLFLWSTTNMPVSAMSPFMWEIGDGKTINMISATRTNASGSFSILKARLCAFCSWILRFWKLAQLMPPLDWVRR